MKRDNGTIVLMNEPYASMADKPTSWDAKLNLALQVFHQLAPAAEATMSEPDKTLYALACKVIQEHLADGHR